MCVFLVLFVCLPYCSLDKSVRNTSCLKDGNTANLPSKWVAQMRVFPRQHYFQRCNHGFTSDGVSGLDGTKCFFFLWKSVYVLKIEAFWRSGSIGGKFGWESSCCASLPIPSHSVSVATDSPYLQAPLAPMQSKLIKTCLHCLDTEHLERKKEKGGRNPQTFPKHHDSVLWRISTELIVKCHVAGCKCPGHVCGAPRLASWQCHTSQTNLEWHPTRKWEGKVVL